MYLEKNKSTTDQIFMLRNIVEQVNEWHATFYANFVDFEKAFDSVHREGVWRIMKAYGIPDKLIRMVKIMYDDFECSVLNEESKQDGFRSSLVLNKDVSCQASCSCLLLTGQCEEQQKSRNGIRWNFTSTPRFCRRYSPSFVKIRAHTEQAHSTSI